METETVAGDAREKFHRGLQELPDGSPLLKAYGDQLLSQGPERFLQELPEKALLEFLSDRFLFAEHRDTIPFSLHIGEAPSLLMEGAQPFSVLEIIVDNRPFLIDSIQNYLKTQDLSVFAILHPILHVQRDAKGKMISLEGFDSDGPNEAHIYFLVQPVKTVHRQSLLEELRAILHDVVQSVDDYPTVISKLEEIRKQALKSKGARSVGKLLEWFEQDNFLFMGFLPFRGAGKSVQADLKSGLGLFHPSLNQEPHHEALISQATRFMKKAAGDHPFFVVEETNLFSRMHHRGLLSTLVFSHHPMGEKSEPVVVAGIFTDRSLRADPKEIPVVKRKISNVVEHLGIVPKSYTHKEVMDFFNGLPRFELFRLSETMLEKMIAFFLTVLDQPRTEVTLIPDPQDGSIRVLVVLPGREPAEDKLQRIRERVEGLFNLTSQNLFSIQVSTFSVLNIVFTHSIDAEVRLPDAQQVEAAVREELLTRDDRLVRMWLTARGSGLEERLARTLVEGLPEEYKIVHPEIEIMTDLSRLETLAKTGDPQFVCRAEKKGGVSVVLYGWEKLSLSRLMPVFTNLRVLVEEEETYEVRLPERPAFLHTFRLHPPEGCRIQPEMHQNPLRDLIFNILENRAENDPLNALLLTSGFDWRQINLMQLYRNYLMQVGMVFTKRTINETLIRLTRATQALYGLFHARFDPDLTGREEAVREAEEEIVDAEREIDNLTEDRIFKSLANLVQATVRTNFYQNRDEPVIAVKMDSAAIEQLPAPRPLYEIYVYGPLMEGIHLRGDRIARGGIRYSDRPDDFRTEVLGLMATQMKKNALIVPLGSKGGFVVKDLTPFGGNARAAGDDRYRAFIKALLSITDNLSQGRTVPPERVVRLDGDDPYLVVAADKGTAHLSDTANEVSEEMGFWLGDAFASGGSHGYDHKEVGITARGAWESVKRLFWEQDVDIQKDPVTVVGIGDMSGDVFGNGMLLSRTLKVVGAFDHRHIFIDPDPDPKSSYKERQRLFQLPRSAWSDYDTSLISEGGGIYPRNSKEIPLTPHLRSLLGTEEATLSGEAMIRSLLSMEVDLLWNGGIGTYVKSSAEVHTDVGDPNNDAVRIDASDLRVKVVGEGGNLGFTQAARIEFDLQGGAIHTDAIDNAGGVNMSDYEVNLKILLGAFVDAGALSGRDARNDLLSKLGDPVTEAVLRANFRQVLIMSMDRLRSMENAESFLHLVDLLAAEGGLDRRTEVIPNAQRFQQFQNERHGIPRPVLAVLLAYTKMTLYKRLTGDPLLQDPYLERFFLSYFPQALRDDFDLLSAGHTLKEHIIATSVTNLVIDQGGMCFVPETAAYSGLSWSEVVQAYLLADAVVEGASYREKVYEVATKIPADLQYRLLMDLEDLLGEFVRWLLLTRDAAGRGFAAEPELKEAFRAYCDGLPKLLGLMEQEIMVGTLEELTTLGLDENTARLASQVPYLRGFPVVSGLAAEGGLPLAEAFVLCQTVNERFRFTQLEEALKSVHYGDVMQKRFRDHLLRSLGLHRGAKQQAVLAGKKDGGNPSQWVEEYLERSGAGWEAYQTTVQQVLASERPEVVSLAVAIGQLEGV